MSFMTPRVPVPPPPPPPPPDPVVPDPVTTVEDEVKRKMNDPARVGPKQTLMTGPRGLVTDAPVEYKNLLGGN